MKNEPSTHVLGLAHPPIPVVRIGLIGLGNRGSLTLERYMLIEHVEIKALCEIRPGNLAKGQTVLAKGGHPSATGYAGENGLGPVCQILNIHRSDRLNYLVSISTHQAGMTEYARRTFGKGSRSTTGLPVGRHEYPLIHTVKGKTIQLQYCTVHPRPYSRSHTICGTRGFAQKYPVATINLEDARSGGGIGIAAGEAANVTTEELLQRYQHPFTATIGKEGALKGAPNEMNYIMDYRLIYCLHHGLPLDMDVYDAAEWSCITELSEQSVLNGSRPVEIPDFTRGAWKTFPSVSR